MPRPSVRRKLAGAAKLAAFAGFRCAAAAGRALRLARPAGVAVGPDALFRTDALLLSALTTADTVRVPAGRLAQLAWESDLFGYLRVLWRCRAGVGPGTVHLADGAHDRPGAAPVRVCHDYYGPGAGGPRLACPYPLHPWFYMTGEARRLARLRAVPRRFRLVFAGAGAYHEADRAGFRFPLLHRNDVVAQAVGRLAARALVVTRPDQVPEIARTDRPAVLVLHPAGPPGGRPEPLLPPADYVRLLASAEFALCPPGLVMPHAHNLIEALAVGTVPVTNYAAWCRPPLAPGRDCLGFETLDDLDAAVERALTAPPAEVVRLRDGACAVYDRELSAAGFAARLAAFLADPAPGRTLAVNVEKHTAELWAAGRAAGGHQ